MTFQVRTGEYPPQPLDVARGREPVKRLGGFGSDKEYEAYAEQQERQQRRRQEREKWTFDGLPTKEEQAAAQIRVERRWICVVEGHDWQLADRWPEWGCRVQQCYRCHNVRLIKEPAV